MPILEFGCFTLDVERCELRKRGEMVRVQRKVFDLLVHLVEHRDRLVEKSELLEQVWSGTAVSQVSLSRTIANLRRILEDDVRQPRWLATVHGRGYRFIGELTVVSDATVAGGARESLPSASGRVDYRGILVGRAEERQLIEDAIRRCVDRSGAILLEGDAGIGKSRLLEWAVDEAERQDVLAILAQCREDEGAPALLPWIDALRQLRGRLPPDLVAQAERKAGPDLLTLCPEAFGHRPDPAPPLRGSHAARFQGYEAVAAFLEHVALSTPLVVLLDDLHRADPSSVVLLDFLLSRLSRTAILFMATTRPSVEGEDLANLARNGRCVTHPLSGLEESDVLDVLHAAYGERASAELASRVWHQTSGNAFFVHQVIPFLRTVEPELGAQSAVVQALPLTVRKAVRQGCSTLSEEAQRALSTASVIGRDFAAPALAKVMGCPLADVLDPLAEAVRARLLVTPDAETRSFEYRFAHLLVRDALYEGLGARHRSELHWRVAGVLEQSGGSAAELAHHYTSSASAQGMHKAVDYHGVAAREASTRLAHDSAAFHYRTSLSLLDQMEPDPIQRAGLLSALAWELRVLGRTAEAQEAWFDAARAARSAGDGACLGRVLIELMDGFEGTGRSAAEVMQGPELPMLLEEAIAQARDLATRARLLARLAQLLEHAGEEETADKVAADALAVAEEAGEDLSIAEALKHGLLRRVGTADAETRLVLCSEILRHARKAKALLAEATYAIYRVVDLARLGRFDESDAQLAAFGRMAQAAKSAEGLAIWIKLRTTRCLMRGEFEEARALIQEGLTQAERSYPEVTLAHQHQKLMLAVDEGKIEHWPAPGAAMSPGDAIAAVLIFLELEKRELVAQACQAVLRTWVPSRSTYWIWHACVLAEAVAYADDPVEGRRLRARLVDYESQHLLPYSGLVYGGPVRRYIGLLDAAFGSREAAEESLQAALEEAERIHACPWQARIHLDLASLYERTACPAEARLHAEAAHDLAGQLGMHRLSERARAYTVRPRS